MEEYESLGDCPKSNYNVIAKEERLKQSLDFKGFQSGLLPLRLMQGFG